MSDQIPDPWRSFLHDLDAELTGPCELHCFGGFVIAMRYGLSRPTADIDILEARGPSDAASLARLAGKGSSLAQRHGVYLDVVTVAHVPENYGERLSDLFPGVFKHLALRALEPHDIALSKLPRNADHDREDIKQLAINPGLDVDVLMQRYQEELRFQLTNPTSGDLTLELWVEMIREVQSSPR
jgi:hypothetical protein